MSVLLAAPILLTLTLLVSGLAKLGARQGTEDAMTSLRLPLRPFHRSVANVLPVVEIVLALVLWIPSVPLQALISALVALLMVAYLVIIARALTFDEQVECSCFGTLASPTVSRTTAGRNVLLVGLAVLTMLAASSGAMTATLVQAPLSLVMLGAALVLAIMLAVLTLGGADAHRTEAGAGQGPFPADGPTSPDPSEDETRDEELLDYERTAIPAAILQQPGGGLITLHQLAAQRAALLIFVSEGCGPCERVLDHAQRWVASLSPFMEVKFVFSRPLGQLRERTTLRVGDLAMHDLQFTARSALGARSAPAAVLLGADGLLAGGPVNGGGSVIEFVDEIEAQLAAAQDDGELSRPTS